MALLLLSTESRRHVVWLLFHSVSYTSNKQHTAALPFIQHEKLGGPQVERSYTICMQIPTTRRSGAPSTKLLLV